MFDFPYIEGYLYKASTPNTVGTRILNGTEFTLASTDVVLLKFDMSAMNSSPSVALSRFMLSSINEEQSRFGEVGYLGSAFNANTTYNTIPSKTKIYSLNNVLYDYGKVYWLTNDGFKNAQYGVYLTGVTGTFRNFGLHLRWYEYSITPVVTGANIESDNFTITFNAPLADNYTVTAIQNNAAIGAKTGTKTYNDAADTEVTIANSELSYNSLLPITFKVEAGYHKDTSEPQQDGKAYYYVGETQQAITYNSPSIISLEPDNVNQNADNNITVSWVTANQETYVLTIDTLTYSGTTQHSLVVPAKTLRSGTKTMTLKITKTLFGQLLTATKTVTFLAYATPNTPQLEDISIYNSATPTFNWICVDAYTSYHFKISNSEGIEVLNTNEVVSSDTSYTSTYALANNSTYTIAVRVKNQFGLWSAWDTKEITTAFVVPNKPNVNVYATNKNSIVINFNITYNAEFEKAEIWRKSPRSEWIRIAYNLDNNFTYEDEFLGSGTHYYKVRAIGTTGGIIESDVVNASISISNFNFANCDDLTQSIEFIGDPSVRVQEIRQIVTTIYAGCAAPKPEIGEVKYKIATCSFTVESSEYDAFMDIFDSSEVILYRDCRGEKIYGKVTSNVTKTPITNSLYSMGFTFTEVSFIEKDMYKGDGNVAVVFFDGAYQFDGAVTFNGEG